LGEWMALHNRFWLAAQICATAKKTARGKSILTESHRPTDCGGRRGSRLHLRGYPSPPSRPPSFSNRARVSGGISSREW
jgi:hypothetical protein